METPKYPEENRDLARRMNEQVDRHPHPLIFASVHGSRLYGFDTPQSDRDIKGCHLLSLTRVIGLDQEDLVVTRKEERSPPVGIKTHDARKYFSLILNENGNVLEEILSPLTLKTTFVHDELKAVARKSINPRYYNHYTGMAKQILGRIEKEEKPDIKFALHMYRSLLTGLHLMKTGHLVAHLPTLNAQASLSHVDELMARRKDSPEYRNLDPREIELCGKEYDRLTQEMKEEALRSTMIGYPARKAHLNDLLIRIRKSGLPA